MNVLDQNVRADQLRAAYLSEDDRASVYWSRPHPYARAIGAGRLAAA